MQGGPVVLRSGKPLVFDGTAPAEDLVMGLDSGFVDEAAAQKAKFLVNRPTTWFRIDNLDASFSLTIFFKPPVGNISHLESFSVNPASSVEMFVEASDVWFTAPAGTAGVLFQAIFALRVP